MLAGIPEQPLCAKNLIFGVDEAGRGPLAGPVVAAAVALCKPRPPGLDDSKKLTAKRRAVLDQTVRRRCAWAVAIIEPAQIDELNIFAATMEAMTVAVARLCKVLGGDALEAQPAQILIDGNMTPDGRRPDWRWPNGQTTRAIVGGDALEPAISAASIIAKEWRDRIMRDAALEYPVYGFEQHKGYGTKQHMEALRQHGPCPLHRRSFAPVSQMELL